MASHSKDLKMPKAWRRVLAQILHASHTGHTGDDFLVHPPQRDHIRKVVHFSSYRSGISRPRYCSALVCS